MRLQVVVRKTAKGTCQRNARKAWIGALASSTKLKECLEHGNPVYIKIIKIICLNLSWLIMN